MSDLSDPLRPVNQRAGKAIQGATGAVSGVTDQVGAVANVPGAVVQGAAGAVGEASDRYAAGKAQVLGAIESAKALPAALGLMKTPAAALFPRLDLRGGNAELRAENGVVIPFQFNPAELTMTKSTNWSGGDAKGRNAPQVRFQSGQSGTLKFTMVLDGTRDKAGAGSVAQQIKKLMSLVTVVSSSNPPRPPWVQFHWGSMITPFKAVVDQLSVRYTYFDSDGSPLRAKVDVSLKEWTDPTLRGPQNPTSGTPEPHSVHHLRPGETLDRVAATHYRDPNRWRLIAEANGVVDPFRLDAGAGLIIPELPVEHRA